MQRNHPDISTVQAFQTGYICAHEEIAKLAYALTAATWRETGNGKPPSHMVAVRMIQDLEKSSHMDRLYTYSMSSSDHHSICDESNRELTYFK